MPGQSTAALALSIVGLLISCGGLFISVVSIFVSVYVARKYGDVAGVKEIIEHEKAKADEAHISALQSLANEVKRIRKLAEHNAQLDPDRSAQSVGRMPVAAFETAFVSGTLPLAVGQDLLNAVTDYLACADSINTLVDVYVATSPSAGGHGLAQLHAAVRETKRICTEELPGILDRLGGALQAELEVAG
jgi:hypothetical protein